MPVATWGYGTGATGTGAHPFCLRVQGVDYIGSVPIESIAVNASVSSNATLTFTVIDPAATMPVPAAWADVELLDTTEQEWIFGGVVMGVEVSYFGPLGVRMDVRCVDYGVLFDVVPVMEAITVENGYLADAVQALAGVAPLGGLTALSGAAGRLERPTTVKAYLSYSTTPAARSSLRSAVDQVTANSHRVDLATTTTTTGSFAVFATPLKQIAAMNMTDPVGTAPLEVRQDPTTSGHVAAEAVSVDYDFRQLEAGVYVSDSYTTDGDQSGWWIGASINGYSVLPGSFSYPLSSTVGPGWIGDIYLSGKDAAVSGQATVVCAKNFQPGQALVVDYPAIGLDGTYAITAVSTRFLGGTSLMRQSTVQFNGERGTVARFNRTRFARAGVTT